MLGLLIGRRRWAFCLILTALCLSLLFLGWIQQKNDLGYIKGRLHWPNAAASNTTVSPTAPPSGYQSGLANFWDKFSHALVDTKPNVPLPNKPIEALINAFANVGPSFSYRPDLIELSPQDVEALRNTHTAFVSKIAELAPQLPFASGTRGIVTTAAGSFVPILIVSLRMLRRTGSVLPVEVFIESSAEYEPEICQTVLPALNARCMVLSEILESVPLRLEISRYQLKAFAMLFSSFDEILLLDADDIPVEKPENLLSSEPFLSRGMVTWPDYWANTASPKFYEISSQPVPSPSERAASESGQLLLSKSKHASTLLLSVYYNHYGPSHYYLLLSQGAVGQGDKETYIAAAMSLSAPFYAVRSNIETLGFKKADNSFRGCGAVQHNPEDDYNKHKLRNTSAPDPRRSFVHAQTYKLDAAKLPQTFHEEIEQRMWGPAEEMIAKFGRDLEKQVWAEMLYTGCHLEHSFKDWRGKERVCWGIKLVYSFLYG